MTGPEMSVPVHYREAERILTEVDRVRDRSGDVGGYCQLQLTAAQVHATLALAAATAYPAVRDYYGEDGDTDRGWAGVAS